MAERGPSGTGHDTAGEHVCGPDCQCGCAAGLTIGVPRVTEAAPAPPWGESMDELAAAVLADKSAPPVLLIAAFYHRRGEPARLRSLIQSAIAAGSAHA